MGFSGTDLIRGQALLLHPFGSPRRLVQAVSAYLKLLHVWEICNAAHLYYRVQRDVF